VAFYNSINDTNNFTISFSTNPKQDFGIFARGYRRAASTLADYLLTKPRFSSYEAYPVVFLYRHAFELYLKGFYFRAALIAAFKNSQEFEEDQRVKLVEKIVTSSHQLSPFAKAFQSICLVLFPSEQELLLVAKEACCFAADFEKIDAGSYSYRYPITSKGDAISKRGQIANLLALHGSMQAFLDKLEVVDSIFDGGAFQAQEIYEIVQKTQSELAAEIDRAA
jgi:hypothetical protein